MFVKNSFEYDARVTREARTLVEAGHDVTVVAIHVPGVTPPREFEQGVAVVRVDRPSSGLAKRLRRFTGRAASTATPGDAEIERSTGSTPPSTPLRALRKLLRWLLDVVTALVRPLRTLALDRRMAAAGEAVDADVYHCHDLNTLRIGKWCVSGSGGRLIYDAHELHAERNRAGRLERWWSAQVERRSLRSVDQVVTASPGYADHLQHRYGIVRPTVVLNVPERTDAIDAVDLRSLLDIGPDRRIVIYQGSIQENRGLEQLIDAVAQIDRCVLVILGYGHHRPALERLVDSRGLEDRVRFHGPVPHERLIGHSAGADVGACCIVGTALSYRLSAPNKLFEYLAAGIPIVVSEYPVMGSVVEQAEAGELCDPESSESIRKALTALLDDPDYADACGRGSRRAHEDRYNWDVERLALLETYHRVS